MNGVLVIDKPAGPTSHDIVASVRRALKLKKVGHTGTLDPAATGTLPLVLGKATKIAQYLSCANKGYLATVRLGQTTDTLDAEGDILSESSVTVTEDDVKQALVKFIGTIDQIPPMYSAKKVNGKRLYQLARDGVEIEREAKQVTIQSIELISVSLTDTHNPEITFNVSCGAGTYIRVLADDLGKVLGCGAHLSGLRRTFAGPFSLTQAVSLEALIDNPLLAEQHLLSMEKSLEEYPRLRLPTTLAKLIANGHQLTAGEMSRLTLPDLEEKSLLTLTNEEGKLIAVARTLVASDTISRARPMEIALKTERVFSRG